jgi:Dolichyl-phosphate-mannose-protein mannosyltransferase
VTSDSRLANSADSERGRWTVLVALCLFCALVGRFCYLARPFDSDAAIFVYMGKMVAEGGRFCHDLIDNKFPTVGLMTSVPWKMFGTSWIGYISLQTIMSLSGAWMLGQMAGRVAGRHAVMPTTLFAIVYLNFTTAVFGRFQLETMQAFFGILAARSALIGMQEDTPSDSFVTGLCAGCAAMFKPTGLAVLGALAIGLCVRFWREKKSRISWHLAAVIIGVTIPVGVALIYLSATNTLADMPGLWRQITTYAAQTVLDAGDLAKPFIAAGFLGFPILVRGWIYRRQREAGSHWPAAYVMVFAIAWLAAEMAGVVMQRRMYAYHFLPIVPPAALIFGLFPRPSRPIPLAAALLPVALLSVYAAGDVIAFSYTGQPVLPATEYLAVHANSGDAVWEDLWPRLMLESGLRPGSRYPATFLFANYDTAGVDYAQQIIGDFERIKPKYIFLPIQVDRVVRAQVNFLPELMFRPNRAANYAAGWHMIQNYTLAHYDREAIVGSEVAYRRRAEAVVTAQTE